MPKKVIEPAKVKVRGEVRWCVIIPKDISEKRIRKFFKSKSTAEIFANQLEAGRKSRDIEHFAGMPPTERALVLNALQKAGDANTLNAAVDSFLSQRLRGAIPLRELVQACCAARVQAGYTANHLINLESIYSRFISGREDLSIADIRTEDVEAFLASNKTWSANTRRNYLKDIVTLFNFAVERKYIVDNPAAVIRKPVIDGAKISILTPYEAQHLLKVAAADVSTEFKDKSKSKPRIGSMIPYFAACLFLGLRPSEAVKVKAAPTVGSAPGVANAQRIAAFASTPP